MHAHDPALAPLEQRRGHRLAKAAAVTVASTAAAACALLVGFGQSSAGVAAAVGLVGGAILVAGLAYARSLVAPVRSAAAIAESLGTRLLASLPAPPADLVAAEKLLTLATPASPGVRRFVRLAEDVAAALPAEARTVLITSPDPAQGKSTTAANLAVELARAGHRVALVDLDGRRPRLHRLFALFRTPGVTEIIAEVADVTDCLVPIDFATGTRALRPPPSEAGFTRRLFVLPAGEPCVESTTGAGGEAPTGHRATAALLAGLQREFDIVVVDAPPLLHVSDTTALCRLSAATVLVTGIETAPGALTETLALLESAQARLLGCVVTAATARDPRYDDEYGWDGTSGTANAEPVPQPAAAA